MPRPVSVTGRDPSAGGRDRGRPAFALESDHPRGAAPGNRSGPGRGAAWPSCQDCLDDGGFPLHEVVKQPHLPLAGPGLHAPLVPGEQMEEIPVVAQFREPLVNAFHCSDPLRGEIVEKAGRLITFPRHPAYVDAAAGVPDRFYVGAQCLPGLMLARFQVLPGRCQGARRERDHALAPAI